jgi:hypothetical protein
MYVGLLQASVTFFSKFLKILAANLVWKHDNEALFGSLGLKISFDLGTKNKSHPVWF